MAPTSWYWALALGGLIGCGQESRCVRDTEVKCSQLIEERCLQAKCQWSEGCVPRACSDATRSEECAVLGHCQWLEDAQACLNAGPTSECEDTVSCSMVECERRPTCSGPTVEPECEQFESGEACSKNPLCSWELEPGLLQ